MVRAAAKGWGSKPHLDRKGESLCPCQRLGRALLLQEIAHLCPAVSAAAVPRQVPAPVLPPADWSRVWRSCRAARPEPRAVLRGRAHSTARLGTALLLCLPHGDSGQLGCTALLSQARLSQQGSTGDNRMWKLARKSHCLVSLASLCFGF